MAVNDVVSDDDDHERVSFLQSDPCSSSYPLTPPKSTSSRSCNFSIEKGYDQSSLSNQQRQEHSHLLSDLEVGISLTKAIMGAGSFALPWAFSNMGYIAGPCILAVLMFMSMYSMKLLIACNGNINISSTSTSSRSPSSSSSYVTLAQQIYGNAGAKLTYLASISASIGVCGSYLVFIAANLETLIATTTTPSSMTSSNINTGGDEEPTTTTSTAIPILSQTTWILIITPIAIGLSSIKNMKHFAFASLLGDIAVLLGMVVVVIYAVTYHTVKIDECVPIADSYSTMALSFGSIGYLFLIHFLVLPIQSNMSHPQNFVKVMNTTFGFCAFVSGIFGLIGYLYFGQSTNQIVLLNIQQQQDGSSIMFVQIVQLLLCIDLLFTYPVVMRPSIVILVQQQQQQEHPRGSPSSSSSRLQEKQQQRHYLGCTVLGIIAASCSIFIPAFGILSGLVGGVSQTFLAFVLPPLMYLKIRSNRSGNNNIGITNKKGNLQCDNSNKSSYGLIALGMILILWTLRGTWMELST